MTRTMTYEEFANKEKWETYGDEDGIWHYERTIGKLRIAVWLSGNDGFWKWSGEPTEHIKDPMKRMASRFVYDCGGGTADEAFSEAYETMSKDGVLVVDDE